MTDQIYPEQNYGNVTELDLRIANYYFPILIEVAKEHGKKITYGDLLKEARVRHPEYFDAEDGKQRESDRNTGRRLGAIWRFTDKKDYPIISALVVDADTGECGRGITKTNDPVVEREKVYAFPWDSVKTDFMAHLSYEREITRRRREPKLKKRTSQEASHLLGSYWNDTKGRWPEEISIHRKELQSEIEKGFDPAIVFSTWVLKRECQNVKPNYVYLAEYRNALTEECIEGLDQIKIGCTGNLEGRSHALSGGVKSPIEVVLRHVWKVAADKAFAVEQYLHGQMREHRVIGEWFHSLDGALAELVQEQLADDPLVRNIVDEVCLEPND